MKSLATVSTVLITGASGYIAAALLTLVRDAWPQARVVGCDAAECPEGRAGVDEMRVCDLTDGAAAAALADEVRPDLVFHLAGKLHGRLEEMGRVNAAATVHLLDALREAAPDARVVVPGSAAEYGGAPMPEGGYRESDAFWPRTDYGLTKAWQTLAAVSRSRRGQDVVVGRLFNIIGPGMSDRLFVGSVAHQLAAIRDAGGSGVVEVGDLSSRRDMIDIRDAAAGLVALAQAGRNGELYNICSGHSVSMRQVLEALVDAAGVDVEVRVREERLRSVDVPDTYGNPGKMTDQTGWSASLTLGESAAAVMAG